MQPLDRFTVFKEFPDEVQLMVWNHARPGPRIIEIKAIEEKTHDEFPCIAISEFPIILHVCHMSRELALMSYKPYFEGILRNPVYFDHKRDELLFSSRCSLIDFPLISFRPFRHIIEPVKFLALGPISGPGGRKNFIDYKLLFSIKTCFEFLQCIIGIPRHVTLMAPKQEILAANDWAAVFKDRIYPETEAQSLGEPAVKVSVLTCGDSNGSSMKEALLERIQNGEEVEGESEE